MAERTVSILAILKDRLSPGLKNVRKNIAGLKSSVKGLGGQFSFLTGTVAKFIGAFAGIQGIRAALDLAKKQVEATKQLAFALEGLPKTYAEINKAADEFQKTTVVGNEAFLRQAAILKAAGVAAEDLVDATKAVFDTATALGKPVESIRAQLVSITGNGVALGELKGPLAGITKEALLQGAAFKVLGERYAGAAEALAQTQFGRAEQEANTLGDTLEEIGIELITLKVAFLEVANKGVKLLLEFFKAPAWAATVNVFKQALVILVALLPTIVKLVVATKAWALAIWLVTTAKLALIVAYKALIIVAGIANVIILTPWLLIPVLVGLAALAIQQFVDIFGALGNLAGDIADTMGVLWDGITSGAIGVGDVIDVVKNSFLTLFLQIGVGFFDPVESAFRKLWAFAVGGWRRLSSTTRLIFLGMAKVVGDVFFGLVTFIAEQIDNLIGLAADALAKIPKIGEAAAAAVRTNIAEATRGGFTALDSQLEAAEAAAISAVTSTAAAVKQIDREMQRSAEIAKTVIEQLAQETEDILERARAGPQPDPATFADGGAAAPGGRGAVTSQQLRQEADLADAIARIRANKNQEALDIIAAQEAEQAERDFNLKRIAESDIAKIRLEFAQEGFDKEARLIRDRIAQLKIVENERIDSGQTTVDVLQKQLALEKELQEILGEQAKAVRVVSDEINEFAGSLGNQATAAQSGLNATLRETAALIDAGAVSQEEGIERMKAATQGFENEIEALQTELLLLQLIGGDTEAFETAMETIMTVWEEGRETLKGITDGIGADAESAWTGISRSFRQQLVGPLTDFVGSIGEMFAGMDSGFDDANDALRDFGRNMLQMLSDILVQWLIMRALGLPTFGSGGGVGANAGGAVGQAAVFAAGGTVSGPAAVHRDIVPAMLTPGEFVMRESAASYYGPGIMRALNRMTFPKALFGGAGGGASRYAGGGFQAGGEVVPSAPQTTPAPAEALVVADDASFARLLAGGQSSMLRFMEANKAEIKGVLGG